MSENAKQLADVAAASVTVATLLQWLPAAAALATLIWTLIRIYETPTVQKLLGNPIQGGRDE